MAEGGGRREEGGGEKGERGGKSTFESSGFHELHANVPTVV
jgi:hypothetical protein